MLGIALVQTLRDSKMLRTAFKDKNAMTVIAFVCTYNDKFKKMASTSYFIIAGKADVTNNRLIQNLHILVIQSNLFFSSMLLSTDGGNFLIISLGKS